VSGVQLTHLDTKYQVMVLTLLVKHLPTIFSKLIGPKRDMYFSPFDGEVIESRDGIKERDPVHFIRDLAIVLKNGLFFQGKSN